MNTLAKRLEARRIELGLSKTDVWKGAGLSSGAYTFWMNGSELKGENLIKVARILKVSPTWLSTGKEERSVRTSNDEELNIIKVPLLSITASMGEGSENIREEVMEELTVYKTWAQRALKPYTSDNNLAFIHAIGDSMYPTFNDGDVLMVDTGDTSATADKIFVLEAHGRLFIKRVRQRIDGSFEISSDNPSIKTVDVLNGDNEVTIKGRVIWAWNGKKL